MPDFLDIDAQTLLLAQDGPGSQQIPLAPDAELATEATGATPGPSGATAPPGMSWFPLLIFVFVAMILFSFLGQRRDRKKKQAIINAVKKHDRVQTVGGVIGSVVELKPDTVVLKVDETSNTRITFARSAIQQVLTVSSEPLAPQVRMD